MEFKVKLISSIVSAILMYFAFIQDIGLLQVLTGIIYAVTFVIMSIAIIVIKFKPDSISTLDYDKWLYKDYDIPMSFVNICVNFAILYMSHSYNFLTAYIFIVALSVALRLKVISTLKERIKIGD